MVAYGGELVATLDLALRRPLTRLSRWLIFCKAGEYDRFPVGKFRYQRQITAHSLHSFAQSRNHEVGSLLQFGNAVLPDTKFLSYSHLRDLAGLAKLL